MMLPKIQQSTIDNVTNEFFRAKLPVDYMFNKMERLKEHDPELLGVINDLSHKMFVEHDDASPEDKIVNRMRAVSLALVVINCVNTQMEIDWLKG